MFIIFDPFGEDSKTGVYEIYFWAVNGNTWEDSFHTQDVTNVFPRPHRGKFLVLKKVGEKEE